MTQPTQARVIEMLYAQAKDGDTQQELVCLAAIAEIERLQTSGEVLSRFIKRRL